MGICCGKTHPEVIQVEGKKEVATSTSSLKDTSQEVQSEDFAEDVQNVSSEKGSDDIEISPLPSIDTKIATDQEDLFDAAAASTRYSTFKHDKDCGSVRRSSVYVKGRRISQDEDQIRDNSTGLRRKSEGSATTGKVQYFSKRPSLPEGESLLDYDHEFFKDFDVDDFEKEASYFVKAILEKEKALALDANQEHEREEGLRCSVQKNVNAGKGRALSADESNDRQRESNGYKKESSVGKTRLGSLKEENEKQRDNGVKQFFDKKFDSERRSSVNFKGKRIIQDEDETAKDFTRQRRKSEEVTSTRTSKYLPTRDNLPKRQALLEYHQFFNGFNDDDIGKEEDRDKGIDDTTYPSQDESDTESFFDIKGEMLSFFNKLEANASFIHSIEAQDLDSTTSEEQPRNDDYSLVREMEAIFDELKQQQDENEASSLHSKSEQESDVESFFDMSNDIEKIISKFERCSVSSKSSDIQKSSEEEETSLTSTPGDSADSGSFFHVQGELESRLQDLVLHLDGFHEESQGRNDEISEGSGEGSYFNMQDDIDMRLDLIRHGNVI